MSVTVEPWEQPERPTPLDRGEVEKLVKRLKSPLPVCPYDKRSPDYWTTPDDQPCVICGQLNDVNAPDVCRGADTRCMDDAADMIERLAALSLSRLPVEPNPKETP